GGASGGGAAAERDDGGIGAGKDRSARGRACRCADAVARSGPAGADGAAWGGDAARAGAASDLSHAFDGPVGGGRGGRAAAGWRPVGLAGAGGGRAAQGVW